MNNEASVFIDSVKSTQNCMKKDEYKTILQEKALYQGLDRLLCTTADESLDTCKILFLLKVKLLTMWKAQQTMLLSTYQQIRKYYVHH